MPDEANFSTTKYGKLTSHCNGVAFNPAITYSLPVNATGTTRPAGSRRSHAQSDHPDIDSTHLVATGVDADLGLPPLTVTVTAGSMQSRWYIAGDTVTVYQSGDSSRYITGTVASWNSSTGVLAIDLTDGEVVGSGGHDQSEHRIRGADLAHLLSVHRY